MGVEAEIQVAVLGAGTMGAGIAIVASRAGCETVVLEKDRDRMSEGFGRIEKFYAQSVKKGKMTEDQARAALAKVRMTDVPADCAGAGFVIEAVYEDLEVKKALFAQMNGICRPDAIFASNTSTLSITSLAAGAGRPDRTVGMHFCIPAPLMKLVEVTRGLQTSEETFNRTLAFSDRLGQVRVTTQDTPGFILNYFIVAFNNDCIRAYESGLASLEDIDKAVKFGLGYPMGPFELLDVIGLDTHAFVSKVLYEELKETRFSAPSLVKKMIDAGHLGRKTGRGFYTYGAKGMFGAV